MGLIRLQGVTKQFGGRVVFDNITLELATGEIIGLVGPNGAGKTTLFKLIAGHYPPDIGTVTISRDLEVGYLPQEPTLRDGATLHDEALSGFADILDMEQRLHALSEQMAAHHDGPRFAELAEQYDKLHDRFVTAGGYVFEQRLKEVLHGLGFEERDYTLPVAALSGGQKCRVALAKLLVQDAQFLLLDEPTNHLDIDAVRWLEKFLAGHHGGAIVISHDRYLLDRIATRILELENGRFNSYPGNYSAFVKAREVRRLSQERQFEQDQAFIEKERAYIARYKAGQRAAQAQGRLKRLERQLGAGEFVLERPGERDTMGLRFDFPNDERLNSGGLDVVAADALAKRYDGKTLFEDLSLRVPPGQRLGITGPNGTGKSTLLKILLGKLPADAGEVKLDRKQIIGYYAQDGTELHAGWTLFDVIREARPDLSDQAIRSFLGRFLFSGDDAFKPVSGCSGGEQSRLRLLRLILSAPSVLVLDEPTNHLDIPSREVLEEALDEFPGTVVVVSHDRYFLDRIVNRLMVMRPGEVRSLNGNYSTYIELTEREAADAETRKAEARKAEERERQRASETAKTEAAARGAARSAPKKSSAKSPYAKLSLEQLEIEIYAREARIRELTEAFGDVVRVSEPAELERLERGLDEARTELAALEEEWSRRV